MYGVDKDPQLVRETIEITMNCAELLNDVGLGMGFLLRYVQAAGGVC